MSAGQMRDYLAILTPTEASDGEGGQSVNWTTAPALMAFGQVRAASSREQAVAGGVVLQASHVVTIAFRDDVTTKQRIRRERDQLLLEIVGTRDPDGRRRLLDLTCTEVV